MLFSFLNLCILSLLSCFLSVCAQFIFNIHLTVKVTRRRVFFPACSSWINILTSSTWVRSDGITGFICFLYLNVFFVSSVNCCGQRTRAGSDLFPLQQNLQMSIFSPSRQLSEITAEPRWKWIEEWNLKESTHSDPVSHISQYDCKSSSNKAQH